jgi:hypothetical protein
LHGACGNAANGARLQSIAQITASKQGGSRSSDKTADPSNCHRGRDAQELSSRGARHHEQRRADDQLAHRTASEFFDGPANLAEDVGKFRQTGNGVDGPRAAALLQHAGFRRRDVRQHGVTVATV